MGAWTVPYGVALALLAGAGIAKLAEPRDTVGALARSGIVVPSIAVRALAAFEVGLAAAALATGARTGAVVVGLSYVVFAGFVVQARARHLPVGSCGCFGRLETPPSAWHLLVNLGCATAALGAAVRGPQPWLGLGDHTVAGALGAVVLVVAGATLAGVLVTVVPRRSAAG
jgi:hypothetical protein